MWKLAIGFVLFAAVAIFVLMNGGDVDMSGEKHGVDASHDAPAATAAPAVPSSAASQ